MTDIERWIKEARDQGLDVHSYVAEKAFGEVTEDTRRRAKDLTFGYLYGSVSENVYAADQHFHPEFDIKGTESRRVSSTQRSMKMFGVRVFNDRARWPRIYAVLAASAVDAQLLAFVLDGGLNGTFIGVGEVELALKHTEVME